MGSFYALSAKSAKPELFRSIFKRRDWHFHGQFKNNQLQLFILSLTGNYFTTPSQFHCYLVLYKKEFGGTSGHKFPESKIFLLAWRDLKYRYTEEQILKEIRLQEKYKKYSDSTNSKTKNCICVLCLLFET